MREQCEAHNSFDKVRKILERVYYCNAVVKH
jgi:hypothetical protein